jgi:cell fate regulator YaaT (PSP1 superfamily)
MRKLAGVRFRKSGKIYSFLAEDLDLKLNDVVVVDTVNGHSIGYLVTLKDIEEGSELPEDIKPVVRVATEEDLDKEEKLGEKEIFALEECGKIVARLGLEMKLISAEYNLDGNFVTIYFGAEQRVDFRELVRDLSHTLHSRVELRQIGPRDEAKMLGGYGRCGREFCCCGFLTEFAPVSIKMAKTQDLPLNPLKISGVCGRLLCCLGYEYDLYKEFRTHIPKNGTKVDTKNGVGVVSGANILAQTVFVSYETGARVEYPVKEVTPIFTEKEMKNRQEPKNKSVENEEDDDIAVEGLEDIVD